jgi:hypothetical protein
VDACQADAGLELGRSLFEGRLEGSALAGPGGVEQGQQRDIVVSCVLLKTAFVVKGFRSSLE